MEERRRRRELLKPSTRTKWKRNHFRFTCAYECDCECDSHSGHYKLWLFGLRVVRCTVIHVPVLTETRTWIAPSFLSFLDFRNLELSFRICGSISYSQIRLERGSILASSRERQSHAKRDYPQIDSIFVAFFPFPTYFWGHSKWEDGRVNEYTG